MPVELPLEAEHLLVDLTSTEGQIAARRDRLRKRKEEIAKPLARELDALPAAERPAAEKAAAERLNDTLRTTYRSELAQLAGAIVTVERRRAQILRQLDAFPQLGKSMPAVDLAVEYDGERDFIIRAGAGKAFRFTLPVPIWRGLWRADGKYQRYDMVTADGSTWIAIAESPTTEPGKSAQWRLAAMKGRNGRDTATPKHMRNSP